MAFRSRGWYQPYSCYCREDGRRVHELFVFYGMCFGNVGDELRDSLYTHQPQDASSGRLRSWAWSLQDTDHVAIPRPNQAVQRVLHVLQFTEFAGPSTIGKLPGSM